MERGTDSTTNSHAKQTHLLCLPCCTHTNIWGRCSTQLSTFHERATSITMLGPHERTRSISTPQLVSFWWRDVTVPRGSLTTAIPLQALRVPAGWGSETIGTWTWQGYQPYALAAFTPENIVGTHFCERLSRPQGHSAAGRFMSMKKSSDTIGNRSRDLSVCSIVVCSEDYTKYINAK
jgi:hypothetical protein